MFLTHLERDLNESWQGSRVFDAAEPRLPNTSCVALAGLPAETQLMALDLAGVAVSSGAACSSGKVQPSHVLSAMGASDSEAGSAIRVSLGWASTPAEIGRASCRERVCQYV